MDDLNHNGHAPERTPNEVLFVRPVEAARMLRLSRSKIYELIRSGEIPSRKFGTSIRVPVAAIEAMARETCANGREA